MLAQALGREIGVLVRGADDIVAWLCAASAFFALGHTFRHGELVRVGGLVRGACVVLAVVGRLWRIGEREGQRGGARPVQAADVDPAALLAGGGGVLLCRVS